MAAGRKGLKREAAGFRDSMGYMDLWREVNFSQATQVALASIFSFFAFIFYFGLVRKVEFYSVLIFTAAAWLAFEVVLRKADLPSLKKAFAIAGFLAVFDFAVESAGAILGLWTTNYSFIPLFYVPGEVVALILVGGTAWALYLPKTFSLRTSAVDVFVIATYGALGEWIFVNAGLMSYGNGWNSLLAFAGYAFTFALLHLINYRILK
ncbi:Uncharacterised protein [uncultured archaeon]|nr:Uncharacterised protein [uncultured archaeon]